MRLIAARWKVDGVDWLDPAERDAGDARILGYSRRTRSVYEGIHLMRVTLWDLKKAINLQFLESFMVDDVCRSLTAINEGGGCCFTMVRRYCTKLR